MVSISVTFSLRVTHGAHTVNFTPWDKVDSGNYINKTTWVAQTMKEKHPWIQLDYKAHDHIKITSCEREMNHIATGRALSPDEELLPPHHGRQQRRWRCWWWTRRRGVEPSGGDSGGVSPLRSSPAAAFWLSVSWFCVSPPPPPETPRGTIFIAGFRSRRSHGDENGWHRSHEGEKGCLTRPRVLAAWDPPISSLLGFWSSI